MPPGSRQRFYSFLSYVGAWLGLKSAINKGKRQIIVAYFVNYSLAETQYPNFGRSRNSAETKKELLPRIVLKDT